MAKTHLHTPDGGGSERGPKDEGRWPSFFISLFCFAAVVGKYAADKPETKSWQSSKRQAARKKMRAKENRGKILFYAREIHENARRNWKRIFVIFICWARKKWKRIRVAGTAIKPTRQNRRK